MLHMISHVIRIDQNIIKIDYYTNIKKIREDVIHKVLKVIGVLVRPKNIKDYLNNL